MSPEVSEIDFGAGLQQTTGTIPGVKTRKVNTTVELADGETLIIAGLLKQTSSKNRAGIPWLSNIPLLGILFSNRSENKDDTELVIFITPKIVEVESNSRYESI